MDKWNKEIAERFVKDWTHKGNVRRGIIRETRKGLERAFAIMDSRSARARYSDAQLQGHADAIAVLRKY